MQNEHEPPPETDSPGQLFGATRWSVVLRAKDDSFTAMNSLCTTYRRPLLLWLKSRGESQETAEDRVQGFFEHLLSREFMKNVGREKGHFRTFLLTSFKHYLRDEYQRQAAQKRGGGQSQGSLDETNDDGELLHQPAENRPGPDLAYDRAWAEALLSNALGQLKTECTRAGRLTLWEALEPALFNDPTAASYAEIGVGLGMNEGAVKTAVHRLKQRLKAIIWAQIMETVSCQEDAEAELKYLRSLFGMASGRTAGVSPA
jgi:RNA polymerase sigma factor (sigma-70 family)